MASRSFRWILQGAMLVASVAVALLLGEGIARLVLNPVDYLIAPPVTDSILGRRLDPGESGHDQWGFRNPSVPDSADVVTIGDSQTYGVGLPGSRSWPAQLATLTGRQVYNASLVGYSPVQYHELLRRYALRLRPSVVVVGFYFGNDLPEAYRVVYRLPYYAALRQPNAPPLRPQIRPPSSKSRTVRHIRIWLSGHSMLYRAALAALPEGQAQHAELVIRGTENDQVRFRHGVSSTVFTPSYRLRAVDLDSLSVREGLRLSLIQFDQMERLCDSARVRLFIALIPTKERVYQHLIDADPRLRRNASLQKELAQEGEIDRTIQRFLRQRRIAAIDLLPALQASVGRKAIYPPDDDGHPTAGGYAIIAREVARAIGRP